MSAVLVALRLLLAAVLALAACAKLADRDGARRAARDLGLPARLAGPAGALLPLVETAVAAALVPAQTARVAALASAGLLAAFTVAIAAALARGRRPDCGCFGRLHAKQIGPGAIARNGGLLLLAAAVAAQPAPAVDRGAPAVLAAVAAVACQAVLIAVLLRRYGGALRRIDELEARAPARPTLEVGAGAPSFPALPQLLRRRRPVLLAFVDSGCAACRELAPKLEGWQRELTDRLTVQLVEDRQVAGRFGVESMPSAVLLDATGRVARPLVVGARAIETLVAELAPSEEPAPGRAAAAATAAALAVGLAAASATHAAPTRRLRVRQEPDPELQAIAATLKAGGAELAAAAQRSRQAVRAQAAAVSAKQRRAKRAAAARAIAAERGRVLALREKIDGLPASGAAARNVQVAASAGLSLLAQSLQKRARALTAPARSSRRLLHEAEQELLQSLARLANAGRILEAS